MLQQYLEQASATDMQMLLEHVACVAKREILPGQCLEISLQLHDWMTKVVADESARRALFSHMTPRERHVIELVASGRSYKDCAQRLGISERTLREHIDNIHKKVNPDSDDRQNVRMILAALYRVDPIGENAK